MPTARTRVIRHDSGQAIGGRATLAVEDPLEIRLDGEVLAVTMRTPGDDFDLALGFALTDGAVDPASVAQMSYCGSGAGEEAPSASAADMTGPYGGDFNVINITTRSGSSKAIQRHRRTPVTSACGICGADVIADLVRRARPVTADPLEVDPQTVSDIPEVARAAQVGFDTTGALHAAGIFDADGNLLALREDVGRHNAVDKVIGWAATHDTLPLTGHVLFTSGRIAFEIVAKAAIAGIPMIVAVSAPTSLAVDLASALGMTLVGFARGSTFTAYTGTHRLVTRHKVLPD